MLCSFILSPMAVPIKILYFLDSEEMTLLEVKLTDLPPETDKSKVCFWLMLDTSSGKTEKLVFVSMESETGKEERLFTKGKLIFNISSGIFETAQKRYPLKIRPADRLPKKIKETIQDYFSGITV